MESLRRLMSRKEDHPWETLLTKWKALVKSLVAGEDWNPWKEWCRSWEMYEKSQPKTPKSGKKREAVWQELYYLARVTANKLDAATVMHQQLKNQTTKTINLQKEATAMELQLNNQTTEMINLKKEAAAICQQLNNQKDKLLNLQKENLLLKTTCESLQEKLNCEQHIQLLDDHRHKHELEKEVNQRQMIQEENKMLRATLQENMTQHVELKYQITALKGQLVQAKQEQDVSRNYNFNQHNQKIIIINCRAKNQLALEEEESWYCRARKAGVGCPSRYKIWKRLKRYEDPTETLDNAPYYQLLARLSTYENL